MSNHIYEQEKSGNWNLTNLTLIRIKNRILTNWTFRRILYLAIGGVIIAQSINSQEWLGIILGGYFASMGIFAFGCASGNCNVGNCTVETNSKSST